MAKASDTAPPAVALEHMTGPSRGSSTWLYAPTLDVTLDAGCFIHISEAQPGDPQSNLIARLHRVDDAYEIEAKSERSVWVNKNRITAARLKHGDTIEFGETGPLCRARFYTQHSPVRNSAPDILSDIWAYLRASRQPVAKKYWRAFVALFGRLSQETSVFFRLVLVGAIISFGLLAYQQKLLNDRLQHSIDDTTSQLDSVAIAMVNARNEALRPSDLAALRVELEQRVTSNLSRLEELELRSTANSRVIAHSSPSVAFLQGTYGIRDVSSSRMLRHVIGLNGVPQISPRGQPLLSLDGDGPIAELQFTGTGFVLEPEGVLVTNRHVALPWEEKTSELALAGQGVEPVMIKFVAYLPGDVTAFPVILRAASETADLAILQRQGGFRMKPGLTLANRTAASGDEVILMGYPTGLRSMLAQSGAEFVKTLQETNSTGFWDVAARLAEKGYIAPLSSRGIIGQATAQTIVYDAETTHGGSGGPVLDTDGKVVAVNVAILPEYGGSNLGVPTEKLRALLAQIAE